MDKEKLNEEARRLNEKIQLITNEVTRNMNDGQQRLREEMLTRHGTLEQVSILLRANFLQAIRNEMENRLDFERSTKRMWDERLREEAEQLTALTTSFAVRFLKLDSQFCYRPRSRRTRTASKR